MQPKGAIAILAAFFLVAVSSWTAACQLSCSLGTSSQCECPPPSRTVPHSHPRMTPACMSGASNELSDAASSAQCATTSGAMQLQAALAVGIPAVIKEGRSNLLFIHGAAALYVANGKRYAAGLVRLDPPG